MGGKERGQAGGGRGRGFEAVFQAQAMRKVARLGEDGRNYWSVDREGKEECVFVGFAGSAIDRMRWTSFWRQC